MLGATVALTLAGFALGELALELRDVLVEKLGGPFQIGLALRPLGFGAGLLELLLGDHPHQSETTRVRGPRHEW